MMRPIRRGNGAVIVTRHESLADYILEQGLVPDDTEVFLGEVPAKSLKGRDVYGFLPMHLATRANSVTEIPLHTPPHLRGRALTLEELREYAGAPQTYFIRRVIFEDQAESN